MEGQNPNITGKTSGFTPSTCLDCGGKTSYIEITKAEKIAYANQCTDQECNTIKVLDDSNRYHYEKQIYYDTFDSLELEKGQITRDPNNLKVSVIDETGKVFNPNLRDLTSAVGVFFGLALFSSLAWVIGLFTTDWILYMALWIQIIFYARFFSTWSTDQNNRLRGLFFAGLINFLPLSFFMYAISDVFASPFLHVGIMNLVFYGLGYFFTTKNLPIGKLILVLSEQEINLFRNARNLA
jgi:hypothetical protein